LGDVSDFDSGWSGSMLGRFFKLFERKSDAYEALLGIGLQTARTSPSRRAAQNAFPFSEA